VRWRRWLPPSAHGHHLWARVMYRNDNSDAHARGKVQRQRDLRSGNDLGTVSEQFRVRIANRLCGRLYGKKHHRLPRRPQMCQQHLRAGNSTVRQLRLRSGKRRTVLCDGLVPEHQLHVPKSRIYMRHDFRNPMQQPRRMPGISNLLQSLIRKHADGMVCRL
jgi:hypothetical protein